MLPNVESSKSPLLVRRGGRDPKKLSRSLRIWSGRGGRLRKAFRCERPPRPLQQRRLRDIFLMSRPPRLPKAGSCSLQTFGSNPSPRSKHSATTHHLAPNIRQQPITSLQTFGNNPSPRSKHSATTHHLAPNIRQQPRTRRGRSSRSSECHVAL